MDTAKKAFENGMDLFHAAQLRPGPGDLQADRRDAAHPGRPDQVDRHDRPGDGQAAGRKEAKPPRWTCRRPGPSPMRPTPPTRPTARVVAEIPGAPVPTLRKSGPDNLLKQQEALAQVEFQQLRSKALKVESEATARFGTGETDAALQDLQNFVAEVKAHDASTPSKQNLLVRPIEARMDRLQILKHQTDFLTKETRDRRNFKSEMTQEALDKQKKQEEVAKLMKQAASCMDEAKYKEAYAKLQMAHQPAIRTTRR